MSVDLNKVAEVLDAAAEHLDALESEKQASVIAARESMLDQLANKYAEATGDSMPDNIRKKLASSDTDIVNLLQSMVEKQASQVDTLGAPSNNNDGSLPLTVKESAEQADSRFLNWLQS